MKCNENRTLALLDEGFMLQLAEKRLTKKFFLLYPLHPSRRASTHQPALQESRSCSGQWPGSTAERRCSSRSRACPRSGRSCNWPGPHTHSRLWSSRVSVRRALPVERPGLTSPYSPIIVARTHFFLLASGIHGGLQLHTKEPSVLMQSPLAHRDSSRHSFTSEGAGGRQK